MQNKISLYTLLFIILAAILVQVNYKPWERDFGVIQADAKGYYAYLPLIFIYDDITVKHPVDYEYKNDHRIWYSKAEDGTHYIKYTMGVAYMYLPFFFTAQLLADWTGYPADGFSFPYQLMLMVSSIFYLILGIMVLRKLLLLYFNDKVVAATIALIYLGTNLFYFYTYEMAVSHGYSFALISIFIYSSVRWIDKPKVKWAMLMGIVSGFMILIRPIDAIFLVFPLLFKINSWSSFWERLRFFRKNFLQLLIMAFLVLLVMLPQLIYWKFISGHFLFFSYTDEHFYFLNPKILWAMFSYRNGWLIYSPLMIIGLIGIFFVRKRLDAYFLPLIIIIPIYIYVISSWWCWWYGGFGNRAFINLYPFFSIAVAVLFSYISERNKLIRYGSIAIITCSILLSLFQSYQVSVDAIHYSDMTKNAYWDSFGRTRQSQLFTTYLRKIDSENAKKGIYKMMQPEYDLLFDETVDAECVVANNSLIVKDQKVDSNISFTGDKSWYSPDGNRYVLNVKFPLLDADEIYVTLWIKNKKDCSLGLKSTDSIPFYKDSDEHIRTIKGWKMMNLFARINQEHKPDSLLFYISNRSENEIWLDDLRIMTRKVNYVPVPIDRCVF